MKLIFISLSYVLFLSLNNSFIKIDSKIAYFLPSVIFEKRSQNTSKHACILCRKM